MKHDPRLLAELALATWHKPHQGEAEGLEATKKKIVTIFEDLRGKELTQTAGQLPLLYVYCLAHDNIRETMPVRAELVDALFKTPGRPGETEIVELYNSLLAPAIADGLNVPNPDAAFKKQLARLAFRKGKVIDEYNALGAGPDRKSEIYKSFEVAVAGDPNNAEYLAARGFAGLDLEPPRVDTALADAKTLIQVNAGYHAGYGLLARASLADVRRRHNRAEQAAVWRRWPSTPAKRRCDWNRRRRKTQAPWIVRAACCICRTWAKATYL